MGGKVGGNRRRGTEGHTATLGANQPIRGFRERLDGCSTGRTVPAVFVPLAAGAFARCVGYLRSPRRAKRASGRLCGFWDRTGTARPL